MRPLMPFPVFSLILASVFLNQTSATPIHSFRNTKLWRHRERFTWGGEDTEGNDGLSVWIDYFKSFWEDVSEEEQSFQHAPSPSESPIPEGAGEFPKKVKSTKSKEGFNEASHQQFVLNEPFYLDVEEEAPIKIYTESKATLRMLMKRAERGSLTGDEPEKWQSVTVAILRSYETEKGAIFFDICFSQLWTYCGWIKMNKTFVPTDKYMRICASLISLGMDDITRPPEEGKDFIVPGKSDAQKIEELLTPMLAISGRQSLNKTARQESVVVELLGYPDYCDTPLDLDPNCYAFCCLTPYYGSQFCHDCGF